MVTFPITSEELAKVFEQIGINWQYEEHIITDYDLVPVNKLVPLTSRLSNNPNQLAKKTNSYEAIANEDMEAIQKLIKELHDTNKFHLAIYSGYCNELN